MQFRGKKSTANTPPPQGSGKGKFLCKSGHFMVDGLLFGLKTYPRSTQKPTFPTRGGTIFFG